MHNTALESEATKSKCLKTCPAAGRTDRALQTNTTKKDEPVKLHTNRRDPWDRFVLADEQATEHAQRRSDRAGSAAADLESARNRTSPRRTKSKNRKTPRAKSKGNSTKTKGFTPKLCTDKIQRSTNLSLRNHRLWLTQAPEKSHRSQERKRRKTKKWVNENHRHKIGIPEDKWRIRVSIPNSKSHKIYHKFFSSLGPLKDTNSTWRGRMKEQERGEGDEDYPSYYIFFLRKTTPTRILLKL